MAQDLDDTEEEGEGAEASEAAAASSKRPSSKKILLFVLLPLILVIGIAAGAYFTGAADPLLAMITGKEKGEHGKEEGKKEGPAAVQQSVFYDLPDMLVNLNAGGRRQSYLKIRVSLELSNPLDIPRIEQVMPRIVDNFQTYLRELRVEDLQGAAGVYRLREELLNRVNVAVKPAKVSDVLFKEMLVQ
jgi:flagellar FliL protein